MNSQSISASWVATSWAGQLSTSASKGGGGVGGGNVAAVIGGKVVAGMGGNVSGGSVVHIGFKGRAPINFISVKGKVPSPISPPT